MKRSLAALCGLLLCTMTQTNPVSAAGAGADSPLYAVADIQPFAGQTAAGTATFVQGRSGKVHVIVRAKGLTNPLHGVHIHTVGDCSAPAASAGHFDPVGGRSHGHPHGNAAHGGDLLNIKVDKNGNGSMVIEKSDISLSPGNATVVGRAIVIHAGEDQYKPDAIGGDRIACGVITLVQ